MTELLQDCRYGARLFLRNPFFTFCIVLSLALGIGLSSAVFSYLNALFLQPIPGVSEADRVFVLYTRIPKSSVHLPVSYPNFQDLRQASRSFSELAASQVTRVALAAHGSAEQVTGELVTADYFKALGVEPSLGRLLLPRDDGALGAHPVAVLSERLWHRRFAADPDIVGRRISLNNISFLVVGIASRDFQGMNRLVPADLWMPMAMYREISTHPELMMRRGDQAVQVLGRLQTGITPQQSLAELKNLATRLADAHPVDNRDQTIIALPFPEAWVDPNSRSGLLRNSALLMAVGGLLLMITCSNVASLLLARGVRRAPELALRAALGARRGRLARQLFTESLLLVALALPASLLLADVGARLLWKFRPTVLTAVPMHQPLDGQVLGFLLLAASASLVLFCVAPVLHVSRSSPVTALRSGSSSQTSSNRSSLSQRWLVTAEVALSFVAISCAVFFLLRLRELQRMDPGFDSDRLLAVSFDLRSLDLDPWEARAFEERLRDRISALPGVQSLAFAENRLLGGFEMLRSVTLPGSDERPLLVGSGLVEPGYFETVGVRILQGRGLQPQDRAGSVPVAVVNQTVADRLWPGGSPVGEYLLVDNETIPVEIVGVVANTKISRIDEPPRPLLYFSLRQLDSRKMSLHVRTSGDPSALLGQVKQEAHALGRDLPLEILTLNAAIERSLAWPRATASLLAFLSALALLIAAIGVYSITAYETGQRRLEIGLRIALGARRSSIVGLLLKSGAQTVLAGTTLGALAALAATRWSAGLLQVSPLTLESFIGCGLLLLAVSSLAALTPALRVLRQEPTMALKGL
ncbi:MAG TPA: ADOP family duplicated permease [Thermoanaerobaculia bacterium]